MHGGRLGWSETKEEATGLTQRSTQCQVRRLEGFGTQTAEPVVERLPVTRAPILGGRLSSGRGNGRSPLWFVLGW